jgi:hypothetical protein
VLGSKYGKKFLIDRRGRNEIQSTGGINLLCSIESMQKKDWSSGD